MTEVSKSDGKTIAIISYITLIGWIIAYIMHDKDKTDLGAFHLRQSLGIIITAIALSVVASFVGIAILSWIIQIAILVFWVLGFVGAVQGEKKLVPLLGAQFQDWFKGIG
ncbi:DUF4870 domain-containing protein [Ulvibacter litoralis]|uniref:DUF4870 domain-containing protein n=1 Tax=Ulvibacter litoralis TaxID=227084 RepID=A0A1G7F932_9FLAO|nr:hypothetical protein [Ulvibacter litoralis]GHC52158.1 hypothetical protein GCM10008083_14890 [Ulvibacter litoralis]SDE72453.1 hypothetical protein SAMN05421855_102414 [Ulvibacter litoralis]